MSDYEELDAQLRAWLDEDGTLARNASWHDDANEWTCHPGYGTPPQCWYVVDSLEDRVVEVRAEASSDEGVARHIARHDVANVLADIAGKRALLDHVAGWQHAHNADDGYFSCGLAIDPEAPAPVPGSGCWDDLRSGIRCSCALDERRLAVLRCIAAGYAGRRGFKTGWRIDG
jgi:hypothetical protein